jgi:hypothetical protein
MGVEAAVAGEGVALPLVHLEAGGLERPGDRVEVDNNEGGCALRAGTNGSSTPTWTSALTAPRTSYPRNQAPPRPRSGSGLSTSVSPSPSA